MSGKDIKELIKWIPTYRVVDKYLQYVEFPMAKCPLSVDFPPPPDEHPMQNEGAEEQEGR